MTTLQSYTHDRCIAPEEPFTDIPSGSYTPSFGGLGGLVTQWTPWHVKDQSLRVTEEARHAVSDTLTASVKLDRDNYVVGDTAHIENNGKVLPGVAQVALQSGKHAAHSIRARVMHLLRGG